MLGAVWRPDVSGGFLISSSAGLESWKSTLGVSSRASYFFLSAAYLCSATSALAVTFSNAAFRGLA